MSIIAMLIMATAVEEAADADGLIANRVRRGRPTALARMSLHWTGFSQRFQPTTRAHARPLAGIA